MVAAVFKSISCESHERRSQHRYSAKRKPPTVLAFPFLLDNKATDGVRTAHPIAARKSTTFWAQDAKSRAARRVALLIF